MKYLVPPALLCLALAGCTASGPQDYATAASTTGAVQPADGRLPAVSNAVGFPSPPTCTAGTGCSASAQVEKCRTIGSVTTCDVPPDPAADDTLYTN